MSDPYKVLGVNPDDSDETIKKAYRELVKKYHPDQYHDNPLASLAEERMKEVTEAYAEIEKQRSSGNRYGSASSARQEYRGNTGYRENTSDSQYYKNIRNLINANRVQTAEGMLEAVADRGAEWYYLRGVCFLRKNWYTEAVNHINRAVSMEPSNPEYRQALANIQNTNRTYRSYYPQNSGLNSDICSFCETLWCADCLCECFGGDLIPCC